MPVLSLGAGTVTAGADTLPFSLMRVVDTSELCVEQAALGIVGKEKLSSGPAETMRVGGISPYSVLTRSNTAKPDEQVGPPSQATYMRSFTLSKKIRPKDASGNILGVMIRAERYAQSERRRWRTRPLA